MTKKRQRTDRADDVPKLAAWLRGLLGKLSVRPVRVVIDGVTYHGVEYWQVLEYTPSMQSVLDGVNQAGDTYTEARIYLLGPRPVAIRKKRNFCFPFRGLDWFVAGYYDGAEPNQYNPCGEHFILHPWDAPGAKIDTYEPAAYLRVPMKLEYCDGGEPVGAQETQEV